MKYGKGDILKCIQGSLSRNAKRFSNYRTVYEPFSYGSWVSESELRPAKTIFKSESCELWYARYKPSLLVFHDQRAPQVTV